MKTKPLTQGAQDILTVIRFCQSDEDAAILLDRLFVQRASLGEEK